MIVYLRIINKEDIESSIFRIAYSLKHISNL